MATLSLTSREYPQHILDETRYLGANPPGLGGEAFLQQPPFPPPPVRPPALSTVFTSKANSDDRGTGQKSRKEFVNEAFESARERFGPKRKDGARELNGEGAVADRTLWSLRDLRKGIA